MELDLARDTKEVFDNLMRRNEENGLTLMFNAQEQVELHQPSLGPFAGFLKILSFFPDLLKDRLCAGLSVLSLMSKPQALPASQAVVDFGKQGFGVCAWDDSVDFDSFPEELREKMREGPFILVNYKWIRELESDFVIIGPEKKTLKDRIKEISSPQPHWDKSTSLPGHFFVPLPKDIYGINDFLKYVWAQ